MMGKRLVWLTIAAMLIFACGGTVLPAATATVAPLPQPPVATPVPPQPTAASGALSSITTELEQDTV